MGVWSILGHSEGGWLPRLSVELWRLRVLYLLFAAYYILTDICVNMRILLVTNAPRDTLLVLVTSRQLPGQRELAASFFFFVPAARTPGM